MMNMTVRDLIDTRKNLTDRMRTFDIALAIAPVKTGETPVITLNEAQANEVYEYLELLDRILTDKINTQEVYF